MNLLSTLGGSGRGRGGVSPALMAVLGVLAYRSLKGKGRLADMFGSASAPGVSAGKSSVAGLSGGALLGGLTDLLDRFRQNNPKSAADSWVASGPNQPVSSDELERTLGAERVQWLTEQTGMSKNDLLSGLAATLPDAIDRLTPDGRIPTEQELERLDTADSPNRPS
jgi:uncharacterized protein YidB (DUF937 family)